eukprot:TRINITY_DN3448_c0_g1_i7.p1 TRINITY_DN3448_c0_g1~~TRINITY_DN3448_c0_g1_i7.p1  ORF type:complete len:348 (-),score=40.03 TRINITY_DN3448_c0_g1_i7:37-1080(-)
MPLHLDLDSLCVVVPYELLEFDVHKTFINYNHVKVSAFSSPSGSPMSQAPPASPPLARWSTWPHCESPVISSAYPPTSQSLELSNEPPIISSAYPPTSQSLEPSNEPPIISSAYPPTSQSLELSNEPPIISSAYPPTSQSLEPSNEPPIISSAYPPTSQSLEPSNARPIKETLRKQWAMSVKRSYSEKHTFDVSCTLSANLIKAASLTGMKVSCAFGDGDAEFELAEEEQELFAFCKDFKLVLEGPKMGQANVGDTFSLKVKRQVRFLLTLGGGGPLAITETTVKDFCDLGKVDLGQASEISKKMWDGHRNPDGDGKLSKRSSFRDLKIDLKIALLHCSLRLDVWQP